MNDVWPVYKGSSFNIWEPDTGTYYDSADPAAMIEHLQEKRLSQRRKRTSAFSELDDSVTDNPETLPCLHPRIAFRDVTRATDTRTLIVALVPGGRVLVNKAPYLLRLQGDIADEAFLLGVLGSMLFDWQARRTVELAMSFEQLNHFSVPDPGAGNPVRDRVVEIAGRLAATDERFASWAAEVGVPVGSASEEAIKQDLICELDACVAHLYGLDEDDLALIYQTFDEKAPDRYADHHTAVLAHFRKISQMAKVPESNVELAQQTAHLTEAPSPDLESRA